MNQGMETRWGSYVKVAANFAANNVQIRLRVARFLAKNEWFDGGGGELGAAARLVYWACNSSATLLHMHIVAEAGRAIVTPAIHWLEEKDGRRLLEFPAYLRRVLSRLAALSALSNSIHVVDEGACDWPPLTLCPFKKKAS